MAATGQLESWKAIAAYLGRDVRTVQRWEKTEGLPVHRLEHQKLGSVFAYTAELDAWLAQRHAGPAAEFESQPAAEPNPAPLPPASAPAVEAPRGRSRRGFRSGMVLVTVTILGLAALMWWLRPALLRHPALATPAAAFPSPGRLLAAATSEGRVWQTFPVGKQPVAAVLAAGGRELYVANRQDKTLSVLSLPSGQPLATLQVGAAPTALATSPRGNRVYVGSLGGGGLSVIDTATRVVRTVPLAAKVADLALSPDGKTIYAALLYDGLIRMDGETLAVSHIATPPCPNQLAVTSAALYVGYQCGGPGGNNGRDAIGIMSLNGGLTGTLAGNVPLVGEAIGLTPDGSEIWADSGNACTDPNYDQHGCPQTGRIALYVFDTNNHRLIRTVPLTAASVSSIQFFDQGERAVLTGTLLAVLDATRQVALEALPVTTGKGVFDPAGASFYVPLPDRNVVAVLHPASRDCDPPLDGLQSWWPGDGTAADANNLLDGQATPAVTYAPARVGQGFRLESPSASINFGHGSSLATVWRSGFSLALWVKPETADRGAAVLTKLSPASSRGWQLGISPAGHWAFCWDGAIGCAPGSGSRMAGTTTVMPNHWYHVGISGRAAGDGAELTLFVNGKPEASRRIPPHTYDPGSDLVAGGSSFRGLLDEIAVYDRPLDGALLDHLLAEPACVAQTAPH